MRPGIMGMGIFLNNSSVCDYGGSMVDDMCEEACLKSCDGMGVTNAPTTY
jgi:hypothetical protein